MIRIHQILLPALMFPGSAIAGCDTDLFASSTCERPPRWLDAEQSRDLRPGSTGLVAAATEAAGPTVANDAVPGGAGLRSTASGPDSED